jgi:hypothetical protein
MSLQYFGHLVLHVQRCLKKLTGHEQAPLFVCLFVAYSRLSYLSAILRLTLFQLKGMPKYFDRKGFLFVNVQKYTDYNVSVWNFWVSPSLLFFENQGNDLLRAKGVQAPLSLSHDIEQLCGKVMNNLSCDIIFCIENKMKLLISKLCYLPVTKEGFAKQRDMCVPEVEPFQRFFFFNSNLLHFC